MWAGQFLRKCLIVLLIKSAVASGSPKVELLDPQKVVPEITALGLKPTVRKVKIKKLEKLRESEDQYFINVDIGQVSAEQFQKLKGLYGHQSQVPYSVEKSYNLIDFLPSVMQALVNHSFFPRTYTTEKMFDLPTEGQEYESLWGIRKNGVSFFTNCWNTTIEVLKFLNTQNPPEKNLFQVRWPGRWEANELLKSHEYGFQVDPKNAAFGDALLVSMASSTSGAPGEDMLQHSAIVIGKNLVFEKTDSSKDDPIRISLKEDVLKKYQRLLEKDYRIQFRRFGGDLKPLPREIPKESYSEKQREILQSVNPFLPLDRLSFGCEMGFGGGCDPVVTEFDEIEIRVDSKTGRGMIAGDPDVIERFVLFSKKQCQAVVSDK